MTMTMIMTIIIIAIIRIFIDLKGRFVPTIHQQVRNLAIASDRASAAHTIRRGHSISVTLKSRLGVILGRWKRHHSIEHIQLTIRRVI